MRVPARLSEHGRNEWHRVAAIAFTCIMMSASNDRVVAVGLLTQRDLDVLGTGFKRAFPIGDEGDFADLLRALERVDGVPDRRPSHDRE